MTSNQLRIGIVGCGGIARAHLASYQHTGDAQVVAVYDVSAKAARALAAETGARITASPAEMAKLDDLSAVSICTPPASHYEVCKPFLAAQVPVLCEKPLEVSARLAAKLAQAVASSGGLFMTAYCHRFHPAIVELKKLIDAGTLGKPLFFRNIFGGYFELKGNHRAKPELSGGGCVVDNCSHSVDLFRFLVGEPTAVQAVAGNILQRSAVEDFGALHLESRGKAFGEITSSYSLKVCGNWVEWYGTLGSAIVSYWNAGQPDLVYRLAGAQDWVVVDCSQHPDRFTAEVSHFLDCVRTGKKPAITVNDGLRASLTIDAAYRSIATGRKVTIKE
ncbi:MAG: Gfo/Idh/MocA family oxidoreductase [Chloroflexi bacterium]|nr:Gfo/Idh/MocA family oxidoreductase [Chloroflexota bacterium]